MKEFLIVPDGTKLSLHHYSNSGAKKEIREGKYKISLAPSKRKNFLAVSPTDYPVYGLSKDEALKAGARILKGNWLHSRRETAREVTTRFLFFAYTRQKK